MCGIAAMSFKAGRVPASIRAVLATNLARYNDERGGHSWGVCSIEKGEAHVARGLGELSDNAFELCDHNNMFLHCRWATHGEPAIKNAHPFKIGNIIGCHNGVIFNHEFINRKYHRRFEVDSQHIFAHLHEGRSLDDLIGYGSIIWTKRDNPSTIYICKLRGGELSACAVGKWPKHSGIVVSSSHIHLAKSLFAAGINDCYRYRLMPGVVYEINDGNLEASRDMRLELGVPPPPAPDDDDHGIEAQKLAERRGLTNRGIN